jgi:hypothetical protein
MKMVTGERSVADRIHTPGIKRERVGESSGDEKVKVESPAADSCCV